MLRKSVVVCLAATAFAATTALMATSASAGGGRGGAGGNVPSPGTWNWPPYSGSFGGMPGNECGYVLVRPYRHSQGHWVYRCH
jgi:hypothetical protein